ncbi:defensin alpha 5-like [Microcebus murinus]|uniref:defensin alpha 5-like n=1 Tax=Microcebus murinus TaxID=30608 RepID=UPI003F6C13CE
MRTLALVAALLLVTLQAQAGPLQERDDEAQAQEQPETEDQVMAISFAGDESSGVPATGSTGRLRCRCRGRCGFLERTYGICLYRGFRFRFCCR